MIVLFAALALASPKRAAPPPPTAEEAIGALIGAALTDDHGWTILTELCDEIGHRLAGSPQLEQAVAWGVGHLGAAGLANVRAEPVDVPVWVRGPASLVVTAPTTRSLGLLALGGSVATPPEGVEGPVRAFGDLAALEAVPDGSLGGAIVLLDQPFTTYGETVRIRTQGASVAARKGAAAVLVRSVTPGSLYTPHTGMLRYEDGVARIPAAAVTVEDAGWLHRLADGGTTVRVRLSLAAETRADAPSANAMGEVRGRERPDEIVVIGCHLDSWDVGQGAQDDGAGCVMVMEAARLIQALPVPPRRTIRVVLFTNEENGLAGATAYAAAHNNERHVAGMEADTGAGPILGFRAGSALPEGPARDAASAKWAAALAPHLPLLAPVVVEARLGVGGSGADVGPILAATGGYGVGVDFDTTNYWPIHHTEADTIDKIDPVTFRKDVAAVAAMAWLLAEVEP